MFTASPKISVTSKLDGIKSWSLQALETCPASVNPDGSLVDACRGCYATTGNYNYPNVKAPRAHNREDWKKEDWVEAMVQALQNERYFRWFDSGDMYSPALAEKIYFVMKKTPWVKHWLPTRMHKVVKFQHILQYMEALPNVVVRRSSDSVTGEIVAGLNSSTIIPNADTPTVADAVCPAYQNAGKCNGCRTCWDKAVHVVAYPAHGVKMGKVIKLKAI